MFVEGRVDAQIEASGLPAPVIPTTAPLLTGRRAIVYVETRKEATFATSHVLYALTSPRRYVSSHRGAQ